MADLYITPAGLPLLPVQAEGRGRCQATHHQHQGRPHPGHPAAACWSVGVGLFVTIGGAAALVVCPECVGDGSVVGPLAAVLGALQATLAALSYLSAPGSRPA